MIVLLGFVCLVASLVFLVVGRIEAAVAALIVGLLLFALGT
jgi:hypothetical protein